MKLFILLLSVSYTSLCFANTVFNLKITETEVSGVKVSGNERKQFKIRQLANDGLQIVSLRDIARAAGDSKDFKRHPFDFSKPSNTKVTLSLPKDYRFVSSFEGADGQMLEQPVSQFVVIAYDSKIWKVSNTRVKGTNFELLTRIRGFFIDAEFWKDCIGKIWPLYVKKFGHAANHVVFVDLPGPISGGPLGENVLGVFATDKFNADLQKDVEANLGWTPQESTRKYIEVNYPESPRKWEEYLLGTISHELGHLYFGFGKTRESVVHADELWFSLGLGMIYDMEITKHLIGRDPQLEVDIIKSWKEKYSRYELVDQRLINPNRMMDKKYSFDRKKVFAHGKAAYFLTRVRREIGVENFDKAVIKYLENCQSCTDGYSDFKRFLSPSDLKTIENVERKLDVL